MRRTVDDLLREARARLRRLEPREAARAGTTDVTGGVEAWKAAGLPVGQSAESRGYADERT